MTTLEKAWALNVIRILKDELPKKVGKRKAAAFLATWKDDPKYVFRFCGNPTTKRFQYTWGTISGKKMAMIEGVTIDLVNKFYTQLVRELL